MLRTKVMSYLLGVGYALSACRGEPAPQARAETPASPLLRIAESAATTPAHVDSAVPRELALAQFQRASARTAALSGGAPTRDELVQRFVRAVERADTAALRRMVLSRGEFAFLYYPTSREGLPPYDLSPDLMWFMMVERSNRGATALVQERSGRSLGYAGYRCLGDSTIEGRNRLWGPCLVRRVQAPGDTVEDRLFGPIVERGGQFKFVSFSNKL
jgi:hypothetical protein